MLLCAIIDQGNHCCAGIAATASDVVHLRNVGLHNCFDDLLKWRQLRWFKKKFQHLCHNCRIIDAYIIKYCKISCLFVCLSFTDLQLIFVKPGDGQPRNPDAKSSSTFANVTLCHKISFSHTDEGVH